MPPDPQSVPLSLYLHLPWCVRKCPYCDFNSHAARGPVPADAYAEALLRDLEADAALAGGRVVDTVFFGGGTPSLFGPRTIGRLLEGIAGRLALADDAEITLEANPGTIDSARFHGFRDAGINRLSIGVQSFKAAQLRALGRIHGPDEAIGAARAARAAGFDNINLDLMYALPEQSLSDALADLDAAIALQPEHLSLYQLTIEPNTLFHSRPPALPDDDSAWTMQWELLQRLHHHGYNRYEVSAFARPGRECRHNLNYWRFGDYLGIGAGAHAKLSSGNGILRRWKTRHPTEYMNGNYDSGERRLGDDDCVIEFAMNALRLVGGVPVVLFRQRTGLSPGLLEPARRRAVELGLLHPDDERLWPTARGLDFLNELVALFMPAERRTAVSSGA
jgi:oxygen-independent coproporphyrinogen-3 oxidase